MNFTVTSSIRGIPCLFETTSVSNSGRIMIAITINDPFSFFEKFPIGSTVSLSNLKNWLTTLFPNASWKQRLNDVNNYFFTDNPSIETMQSYAQAMCAGPFSKPW